MPIILRLLPALFLAVFLQGNQAVVFAAGNGLIKTPGTGGSAPVTEKIVTPPAPGTLKPEEVEGFVSPLTDTQARKLLIDQLKVDADQGQKSGEEGRGSFADILTGLRDGSAMLAERVGATVEDYENYQQVLKQVVDNLTDLQGPAALLRAPEILLAMLLAGAAGEYLFRRALRSGRQRKPVASPSSTGAMYVEVAGRFARDLTALLLFAVVSYLVSFAFLERFDPMRELVTALALWCVALRVIAVIGRALFGDADGVGLFPLEAVRAWRARLSLLLVGGLVSFLALSRGLFQLLGLTQGLLNTYSIGLGLIVAMLVPVVIFITRGRRQRAAAVIENAAVAVLGEVRPWRVSPFVLAGYIFVMWVIWSVDLLLERDSALAAIQASVVILLMPVAEWVAYVLLLRIAELRRIGPNPERLVLFGRGRAAIFAIVRAIFIIWSLAFVSEALGFGIIAALSAAFGKAILSALLNSAITVLVALFAWEVVTALIDRQLGADELDQGPSEAAKEDAEGGTAVAATRAETILPLVRSFFFFVLVAVVTMLVLSSLGVNIGPLLAGAGVAGIAIGFGAQTLVRDIVSGIFFLIDDAFRLGEYIEMGPIRGEVEKISVRSLRLRHHRGAIHTIPFGELRSITNYNRDWVIYKMPINLPYDVDIDKVKKIIKQIGLDMMADPVHGKNLLEPLKSQGVTAFSPSSMTLRVKFKCKPREQFVLRRVAHQRIRDEFFKHGIRFAYPVVTVHVPGAAGTSDEKGGDMAEEPAPAGELTPDILAAAAIAHMGSDGEKKKKPAPVIAPARRR